MDINRFEDQVKDLEKDTVYTGRVLFYGNSNFAFWDNDKLEEMLSGMSTSKPVTINHGFGGATGAELLHYYPRLVKPYAPKAIVWCEGGNDFEQGFTLDEAFENAKKVFNKLKDDFSDVKIIMLSAAEAPKIIDFPEWIQIKKGYDKRLSEYAINNSNCLYIDIVPFFYEVGQAGNMEKFRDIFRDDRIHLNDNGYKEFALYLKDKIVNFLKEE